MPIAVYTEAINKETYLQEKIVVYGQFFLGVNS